MSGTSTNLTMEYAIDQATAKGCTVRFPKPNELFLDLDREEDYVAFDLMLQVINENVPQSWTYEAAWSKSGPPRRHVVVTMHRPTKDELERVLLQAVLGSDRKREILSWLAVDKGINGRPTMFFEKFVHEAVVVDG